MNLEEVMGREPCCDEDYGGSHYHCGRCGKTSSMMGHLTTYCKVRGRTLSHMCCPSDCELNHPEEIEAEVAFWRNLETVNEQDYSRVIGDIEKKLAYSRRPVEDSTIQGSI